MEELKSNKKGIELLLSVLLAVSVSYGLTLFIEFNSTAWLIFSLLSISGTILIIYFMMNLNIEKIHEWFMLSSFSLVLFIPFSLKKMMSFYNETTKVSGDWWSQGWFFLHLFILGGSLILWGVFHSERRKELIWSGIVMIIFTLIIIALIKEGILQNG